MSTKTTIKRIALVAVAALGLGMVSTVASNAAVNTPSITLASATSTSVPGVTPATVNATIAFIAGAPADAVATTVVLTSAPAGNTALPVWANTGTVTNATGTLSSGNQTLTTTATAAGAASNVGTLTIGSAGAPLLAGTYVSTITQGTATLTWTVTVSETATAPTAYASGVFMQAGAPVAGAWCADATSLLRFNGCAAKITSSGAGAGSSNGTAGVNTYTNTTLETALAANVVTQKADLVNNVTTLTYAGGFGTTGNVVANVGVIVSNQTAAPGSVNTLIGAKQDDVTPTYLPVASTYYNVNKYPVTATITGPGWIKYAGSTRGKSYTENVGDVDYLQKTFLIVSDGTLGTATITFTAGGNLLATRTINFVGATSVIAEDTTVSPSKKYIGVYSTGTITWKGYDANGLVTEAAPAALDFAVSSDTSVATVTALNGVATVYGAKPGTATITICDTASCVSPTIKATATVTITGTTVGSVSLAWDNSSYAPGEKMTLTVTVKDTTGAPIADGSYDLFGTAPTPNVNLTGWVDPSTGLIPVVGGVATYTAYAPLASGSVVVSGTDSASTPNTVSATATVSGPTDAAIDAANEATDAANAATDAANAAAEAADAATAAAQDAQAAVAELATQVAALIAGIKAQITTLTNLVIKIQKKVKA